MIDIVSFMTANKIPQGKTLPTPQKPTPAPHPDRHEKKLPAVPPKPSEVPRSAGMILRMPSFDCGR